VSDGEVRIRIRVDGPYVVTGPFTLTDHEGNVLDQGDRPNVALCRCGHSGHRPFCDGTHKEIGFDGTLAARPEGDEPVS
jgi:CDGSH-type Zn-finger protein